MDIHFRAVTTVSMFCLGLVRRSTVASNLVTKWGRRGIRGGGGRETRAIAALERGNRETDALDYRTSDSGGMGREKPKLERDSKIAFEQQLVKDELSVLDDSSDIEYLPDKKNANDGVRASYRSYRMNIKKLKGELSSQMVTVDNQQEMVVRAVTMLNHLPYNQQLAMKQVKNKEAVDRLKRQTSTSGRVNCSPCRTVPSPVTEQYRVKDQFSVLTDVQGQVTVGFYVGGRKGGLVCVEPTSIRVIKDTHKQVAASYQKYLRQSSLRSNLHVKEIGGEKGNWDDIMVRTNYKGEIMVKIKFHQRDLEDEVVEREKQMLADLFNNSGLPIASLYLAVEKNDLAKNCLLLGSKTITEVFEGVPMLLGPDTFTQVNPGCVRPLLDLVTRKVDHNRSKTLLDLCCGGGLYSLHLAKLFRGCVGVDMIDTSLAKKSAEINQLENCNFLNGRLQVLMPQLARDIKVMGGSISAILNPGRAGVTHRVIQELRCLSLLDTLVYISCEPEETQVFYNMVDLMAEDKKGTPVKRTSKPFSLVEAVPVDMFPHTQHCEHVFVFKR